MNLALSGLVLLAIALPGFIFRYCYHLPERAEKVADASDYFRIGTGLLVAALLHFVWCTTVVRLFGDRQIDWRAIGALLAGSYGKDDKSFNDTIGAITAYKWPVCKYFFSLYAFSALLGVLAISSVLKWHIDDYVPFLRLNPWFYFFSKSGNVARQKPPGARDAAIFVTALVEGKECNLLYRGFLVDVAYDVKSEPQHIVLRQVARRKVDPSEIKMTPEEEEKLFFSIDGDAVLLPMVHVRNLCVRYLYIIRRA